MILPNPAVAELVMPIHDEVTGITDTDGPPQILYLIGAEYLDDDGGRVGYDDPGGQSHGFAAPGLAEVGYGFATADETVRLRAVDPYDAVRLAPNVGVPQPIDPGSHNTYWRLDDGVCLGTGCRSGADR